MKKTFLIHNGACQNGIVLCKRLLEDENTKKIICVDNQEKINNVSELLSSRKFVFIPLSQNKPVDINEKIDSVIIAE